MALKGFISIPSELITEILYHLPSKSVGRFRCVSKDWQSILSSPQFIKIHQHNLNRNHFIFDSYDDNWKPYLTPFHYHEEEVEVVPTKFRLEIPDMYLIFHGSCNGLVLLSALNRCSGLETLVLSNPTTREFFELPDCDYEEEGVHYMKCIMYGLGYDYVTDDYKVFTIYGFLCRNLNVPDIMPVHVYSLRTNTWKRVMDYPDKYHLNKYHPGPICSDAFLNGFFHWVGTKGSDLVRDRVIIAFSLADENFSEVPSPKLGNGADILNYVDQLNVLGGKLAIFLKYEGEVWLMNEYGVQESWTKIILNEIPMSLQPRIFYDNGKIMIVSDNKMLAYDIDDGRVCKRISTPRNMRDLIVTGMCIESLVSPKFNRTS